MEQEHRGVAKLIVRVTGFGSPALLLSRKRAKGNPGHKMLEFLGGGVDGERPLEGLVRELEEEEKTGFLARRVKLLAPDPRRLTVDGVPHYVYELSIGFDQYLDLQHDRKESFGFRLVPASMLRDESVWSRLTERTRRILTEMGRRSPTTRKRRDHIE
ncbi:MAG: NUDIX hydrolase [Gemmatimonadales bacterium]